MEVNSIDRENFLKGKVLVSDLAKKCKSKWTGQGCSEYEKQQLMQYTVYVCGEIPERAHSMSIQYLKSYMTIPMINMAFLRVWSLLNSGNLEWAWALCAVCLFDYPPHPYWERDVSFCD